MNSSQKIFVFKEEFPLIGSAVLHFQRELSVGEFLLVSIESYLQVKEELQQEKNKIYRFIPKTEKFSNCKKAVEQLQEYLQGSRQNFTLKFKIQGSDFARDVYRQLCQVDYGSTISYGELAERAGYSGAARAVGQALNKNPLPLVVPCHRVITSSGEIGGFGWGSRIKSRLLKLESQGKKTDQGKKNAPIRGNRGQVLTEISVR